MAEIAAANFVQRLDADLRKTSRKSRHLASQGACARSLVAVKSFRRMLGEAGTTERCEKCIELSLRAVEAVRLDPRTAKAGTCRSPTKRHLSTATSAGTGHARVDCRISQFVSAASLNLCLGDGHPNLVQNTSEQALLCQVASEKSAPAPMGYSGSWGVMGIYLGRAPPELEGTVGTGIRLALCAREKTGRGRLRCGICCWPIPSTRVPGAVGSVFVLSVLSLG